MPRPIAMLLVCLLAGATALSSLSATPPAAAQPMSSGQIFLRRGSFDPLQTPPSQPATREAFSSGLLLVQFDHAPESVARIRRLMPRFDAPDWDTLQAESRYQNARRLQSQIVPV